MSSTRQSSIILALLIILLPSLSQACSVCMGAADGESLIGVQMAVFLLLGVTGTMLSSIGAFIFHLRRRARELTRTPRSDES